jgi:hypothetical protein
MQANDTEKRVFERAKEDTGFSMRENTDRIERCANDRVEITALAVAVP